MKKNIIKRGLTGVPSSAESDREIRGRRTARAAASQGMVLLKNEGAILPLSTEKPVALYGAGAAVTVKGGSGSGDVNSRHTVSIYEGMKAAGYQITTEEWLADYQRLYQDARNAWKDEIWARVDQAGTDPHGNDNTGFFLVYASMPFLIPSGSVPAEKAPDDTADTAIYVIARTAGEGADRHNRPGDYQLTDTEEAFADALCRMYDHVILVLNTGGLIDLGFTDAPGRENIDAILYIHQPGMEAGTAFADIISGAVTPSAKLTDSWAYSYADYPNAETFSYNSGNVEKEAYVEGIYVGYRYFDTFEKPVRYCFGYGLSYTTFAVETIGLELVNPGTKDPYADVTVRVSNTGPVSGAEVVQLYAARPQDRLQKEYRSLVGFAKTAVLSPGEAQTLRVSFPLRTLASYDEAASAWVLEKGFHILLTGTSLESAEVCGAVEVTEDMVFTKTEPICPRTYPLSELTQSGETAASVAARRERLLSALGAKALPVITVRGGDILPETIVYSGAYEDTPQEVRDFVDTLSLDEIITLSTGDVAKGINADSSNSSSQLGSAGTSVPGSAAQTSDCAADKGLADIVLADGPAGLRLNQSYQAADGVPIPAEFEAAMENGFLVRDTGSTPAGETYYQYCTAFPTGTQLAQSWDTDLIEQVGRAVSEDLAEFHVTLWLAPGMNIHRNPLCGRNFEYYSEDPVLSGLCAAAMTDGVQSADGIGTTIKHFACNNQEDNRMGSDSILSERALREIYLKGFEIAVKKSHPMSIMTSYNLINGVHAANSYDLCTKAARCEWGFDGVIMTDWTTTMQGPECTASGCMRAGNDLVMPGAASDHEDIRRALADGSLPLEDLKRSVARLVKTVWASRNTGKN